MLLRIHIRHTEKFLLYYKLWTSWTNQRKWKDNNQNLFVLKKIRHREKEQNIKSQSIISIYIYYTVRTFLYILLRWMLLYAPGIRTKTRWALYRAPIKSISTSFRDMYISFHGPASLYISLFSLFSILYSTRIDSSHNSLSFILGLLRIHIVHFANRFLSLSSIYMSKWIGLLLLPPLSCVVHVRCDEHF